MACRSGASSKRGGEEEEPSDNQLSRSGIARMMRAVLDAQVKVSGPAKNLVQTCAKEFIVAVVDEATKQCHQNDRQMLTPEDVALSLRSLGLNSYIELMGTYLRRYRETPRPRDGARESDSTSAPAPAAGDHSDEELLQILDQAMDEAIGNGNGSS